MKNIALIPARGGSKGLPGKNIKKIAGLPLIAWSILQLKESKLIDRIFVSTDCPEIANISKEYGAEVPFLRPPSISGDYTSTEAAMIHFLNHLKLKGEIYDNIVLVQCTSPIREKNVFDDALKFYKEGGFDSLLTVVKNHRFFWSDMKDPYADYDYVNRPRRQDIKDSEVKYMETGSFYISNIQKFIKCNNRLFGKIGLYETDEVSSFEIDSYIDFVVCESILNNMKG